MKADDERLFAAFVSGTLSPAAFSHRDHVAAAFEALFRHEFFAAAQVYASALRALTVRAGVPEKFNATVTLGFLSLIAEIMAEGHADADSMIAAHPELLDRSVLAPWYSAGRLASPLARRVPVLPDRGTASAG